MPSTALARPSSRAISLNHHPARHSVVATGWQVGDQRTVQFVERFYAELARGQPVSEALRAAKLAALQRGAPAAAWAAFMVVGDPLVTVPLGRKPS